MALHPKWVNGPLNENEVRFLRKCVRHLLFLRKTKPDAGTMGINKERGNDLWALAMTFVEPTY